MQQHLIHLGQLHHFFQETALDENWSHQSQCVNFHVVQVDNMDAKYISLFNYQMLIDLWGLQWSFIKLVMQNQ